jgi:hypothetical protein
MCLLMTMMVWRMKNIKMPRRMAKSRIRRQVIVTILDKDRSVEKRAAKSISVHEEA